MNKVCHASLPNTIDLEEFDKMKGMNDPLIKDFMDKANIIRSNETGLNKAQRKEAYKIYNHYDLVLSGISASIILFIIVYMFCSAENIIHQPVDAEILITLLAIALVMIVIPVTEFIIFKKTITHIRKKYHIKSNDL